MKKHKNKIICGILLAAILIFAYWWGGNTPGARGWNPQTAATPAPAAASAPLLTQDPAKTPQTVIPAPSAKVPSPSASPIPAATEETPAAEAPAAATPIPEAPLPMDADTAVISDTMLSCTLSVRCDTILSNMGALTPGKADLIPPDGVILPAQTVPFYEGESVFNLLVREMKRNKIHLEFVNTPLYSSAYIEGIHNIYEFDCGELSGWMYKVNGVFPNYGSSRYKLHAGDVVEWVFTCNLGADVGGAYAGRNGA